MLNSAIVGLFLACMVMVPVTASPDLFTTLPLNTVCAKQEGADNIITTTISLLFMSQISFLNKYETLAWYSLSDFWVIIGYL